MSGWVSLSSQYSIQCHLSIFILTSAACHIRLSQITICLRKSVLFSFRHYIVSLTCLQWVCVRVQVRQVSISSSSLFSAFLPLVFPAGTDRTRQYTWFTDIRLRIHTRSNKNRETWLYQYLWQSLCSLHYNESAVNKSRLEKWVSLVLLFSSLCPLPLLSAASLYGKSLLQNDCTGNPPFEYQKKKKKKTHTPHVYSDWMKLSHNFKEFLHIHFKKRNSALACRM